MKNQTTKLQYIVGKRNGRFYKIFLNDLKSIKCCGRKNRPRVPDFDEPKQEKPVTPMEFGFVPFEIETC
jgi:hypothetical protein